MKITEVGQWPKAGSERWLIGELADWKFRKLYPDGCASEVDWSEIEEWVLESCTAYNIESAAAITQYSKWQSNKLANSTT